MSQDSSPQATAKRSLYFCFDLCSPHAYLASERMALLALSAQQAAVRDGASLRVEWKPVFLQGIHGLADDSNSKSRSINNTSPINKRVLVQEDLEREFARHHISISWNKKATIQTHVLQCFLCGIKDQDVLIRVARRLFHAYWVLCVDISDLDVLMRIAQEEGITDAKKLARVKSSKRQLEENTDWVVSQGAFDVPSFIVEVGDTSRIFVGNDRTHFAMLQLGVLPSHSLAKPLRVLPTLCAPKGKGPRLTFYHDFSSPWSYLGSTQIFRLANDHGAQLVFRPILLGALFRNIGTPNVPMLAVSPAKRAYGGLDLKDWCQFYGGIKLRFPDEFPLRTVLPLRVAIVNPATTLHIYQAAWVQNKNIGDSKILHGVLASAGFDAEYLLAQAETQEIKEQLKQNTIDAEKLGVCGVPTYRVGTGAIIWGQDRSNVVADMLSDDIQKHLANAKI
mmetsp:Transcript_10243/g.20066  ORF Transcript_10243/g.20066 Transcript_10243/m.20066 type:complete len:450 (+) Transcript_10243:94-1443(+)